MNLEALNNLSQALQKRLLEIVAKGRKYISQSELIHILCEECERVGLAAPYDVDCLSPSADLVGVNIEAMLETRAGDQE